jgi:PAS domain S-box-containing protein
MKVDEHYLKKELYSLVKEDSSIFDFLQEGSLDGLWYWDLENPENGWINSRCWILLGYDPQEKKHLANELQDIIFPEDLQPAINNFNKHCSDSNNPCDQVVRCRHKDGSIVWVRCRGFVIRNENGKPIRMLGVHTNLTPQKQAEEKFQKSDLRFKKYFELGLIGMVITSPEKGFVELNDTFCDMLGYSRDELVMLSWPELTHPDDLELDLAKFNQVLSGETEGYSIEKRFIRKDGAILFTVISIKALRKADGSVDYIVALVHDISERIKATEESVKIKKIESVGILAGGIAHDFNNILAAIIGNLELAEIYTQSTNEAYTYLKESKKASIRARDLTRQLLTFAKGGDPVKQTSSIGEIITDSANFVLHGSAVICDYNITENLWQVDVDTGQIGQVIQNIIINACHAMPEGGVVEVCCENIRDITKETLLLPLQKYIKITIADSGSGIAEKCIDKIFDPYFSTKKEGSGLGLAICHSIIRKHGGTISVQSEVNNGTTFIIYLPASCKTSQDLSSPKQIFFEAEHKATIMVMDDDSMVRDMSKQMLELFGHEVLLVENGNEAIELYAEYINNNSSIDITIMDLTIPGEMGGKDAVQEILKLNPDAKVIVASGYSNDPVIAHYQEYGFKGSIAKPFQLAELNELVNTVLGPLLDRSDQ